jgi:magnesium transporter
MRMELTPDFLENLSNALQAGHSEALLQCIGGLHPSDLASIMEDLPPDLALLLYHQLEHSLAADVLTELDEDFREKFLKRISSREIAEQFSEHIDSDDAADILADLPEKRQREILAEIPNRELASNIEDLLQYDEDSAGGLMAKELVRINEAWDRNTIFHEIRRQAQDIDNVYTVYVVNSDGHLKGILPLKRILLAPDSQPLSDIILDEVVFVHVSASKEKVAQTMQKYDLVALPVVDSEMKLLGRITIDDVLDVIQEEAEKDYQLQAGLSEDVEADDSIAILTRARLPWLLVGLFGGIMGAQVIGRYENEIQLHPEMAFFIPLVAAMGGNAGVQSSAIVVQGIASGSLQQGRLWTKFLKELSIGMINGLVCATVILLYSFFFSRESAELALTVSTAMVAVIVCSSVLGTFIPLTLNRFKVDPALATGPFITTMNDIIGLLLYFSIGRLMYGLFI